MNTSYNFIPIKPDSKISISGDRVIALQGAGKDKMKEVYGQFLKENKSQTPPVIEAAPAVENLDVPENNTIINGAKFEPVPTEIVDTPITDDIVKPFSLDNKEEPAVASFQTPTPNEQPIVKTATELSDEELIIKIEDLLKNSSIKQEIVKEQIMLNVKIGLNTAKILSHLDNTRVETADLANATKELAQANQQIAQNVNGQQPNLNQTNPQQNNPEGPVLFNKAA